MELGKVFGYPEFDDKGEMILTTYDNEYQAMMMDKGRRGKKIPEAGRGDGGSSPVRKYDLCLGGPERDGQQKGCIHRRTMVRPCKFRCGSRGNGQCRDGDSGAVYPQ